MTDLRAYLRERGLGGPPGATIGAPSFAYVFGSVLVFLLVLEAATGLALAAFYAPSSTDAWGSVAYVQDQVHLAPGLTANLGLRYDQYSVTSHGWALSPRIKVSSWSRKSEKSTTTPFRRQVLMTASSDFPTSAAPPGTVDASGSMVLRVLGAGMAGLLLIRRRK